jgi:hypothetical protein
MAVNDENLAVLSSRYGINAMVNYFNGELGNDINDLVISSFYDNYILDAIELASENYIFQQYAKPYYVPEGHEKKKLKRYGALTEHTTPLPEGIPPKSDKTRVESFEATFNSYGRYMEFTDRVSYMTIDPVIVMYTDQYGKLAARTKERLARNEMLHSTSILVPQSAGGAADLSKMMLCDALTFNDYRVQVARMKRMLVEPVEGNNFHLIGSPEVKFDLITDELVRDFYGKDTGITAYQNDELPVLFNIKFKETMLDDYAYGYELANPGEIETWDPETKTITRVLRIYAVDADGVQYYINVPETGNRVVNEARLSDGSYIPEKVTWKVAEFIKNLANDTVFHTYTPSSNVKAYDGKVSSTNAAKLKGLVWKQLPFHKCILIGADALIETGIEGHTQPKMYVKPLGSAGVLDPIDQRQSIGFKIDTIGYSLLKPEACVVCYTIPTSAIQTNDLMYYDEDAKETANLNMKHHSYDIPGKAYVQSQVRDGYNMYGKINKTTGNVDTDRDGVPGVQAPYYDGLDEFGEVPVRVAGAGMSGEKYGTNQSVPHVDLHTTAEELAAAVKEAKEYADSLLETDGE